MKGKKANIKKADVIIATIVVYSPVFFIIKILLFAFVEHYSFNEKGNECEH